MTKSFDNAMLNFGDVAELEDAVNNVINLWLITLDGYDNNHNSKLFGFTGKPCAGSNPAITIKRCLQQFYAYDL